MLDKLTKEEKHFLEYFWNIKKNEPQLLVPANIVAYIENGTICDSNSAEYLLVIHHFTQLMKKNYVITYDDEGKNLNDWILTRDGEHFLKMKHSRLETLFTRINSNFPPILLTISSVFGVIAVIVEIIKLFKK